MTTAKLRRQILWETARLLFLNQERDYYRAKLRAARQICPGAIDPADLPTNREIRDEVELLVHRRNSGACVDDVFGRRLDVSADRFRFYATLLSPLEQVKQNPKYHPEGDALYHSLQVFQLARGEIPYDEEFLLAALLHDVGKAIDLQDHVAAALDALNGTITLRTAWFIEHQAEAQAWRDGKLGARSRRRLGGHEDYDELMLLVQCDRLGRRQGVRVPDVGEALDYLRALSSECES